MVKLRERIHNLQLSRDDLSRLHILRQQDIGDIFVIPSWVSWSLQADETGALVSGGLLRISRNPTFLGQALLPIGAALAVPSLPTAVAPLLRLWSARIQIGSEEAVLMATHGQAYADYAAGASW